MINAAGIRAKIRMISLELIVQKECPYDILPFEKILCAQVK
jgi:hypothetical protein